MQQTNNTDKDTICEECDQSIATEYCRDCGQNICKNCDQRIHNKGKRKIHVRCSILQDQIFFIFHEDIIEHFDSIFSYLQKKIQECSFKKNLVLFQNKQSDKITIIKSLFEEQNIFSASQTEVDFFDKLYQPCTQEVIIFGQSLFNEQILKSLIEQKKNEQMKIFFYEPNKQKITDIKNYGKFIRFLK